MAIPLSTLSVQRYECPRCHAKPGDWCREPKGRRKSSGLGAHGERMALLKPEEKELSLIKITVAERAPLPPRMGSR